MNSMENNIHDEERLFRRLKDIPQYWKKDTNRPTSALFKDSKGVSVDRCNFRCKEDIIKDEERLHDLYGGGSELKCIVSVKKENCDEVLVKYEPEENNDYHSVIYSNEDNIVLTRGQAKKLANLCNIEKSYN